MQSERDGVPPKGGNYTPNERDADFRLKAETTPRTSGTRSSA